jgi:hypothetical protein
MASCDVSVAARSEPDRTVRFYDFLYDTQVTLHDSPGL